MITDVPTFKGKTTQAQLLSKEEVPISPTLSCDTPESMKSLSDLTNSKYLRIKKSANLFSMALNELRELRNVTLSSREYVTRAEEIVDIMKIKMLKMLEET